MQTKVTIDMIETKDFKHERDGYSQMEVDTFLDDICDEMERLLAEINSLQQQLNEARSAQVAVPAQAEPAAPAAVSSSSADDLREILEMAQQVKKQTIADAQKKAEQIVADAEEKVRVRLGSLIEEKDSLTKQVESLKKTVSDYRTRFTDLLKIQQEAMDELSDL